MFPMRLKIGPSRNNEWRCCFCLHVRTATTLLGIWHLMLHVLALSILALIMRNYHYRAERSNDLQLENILPTPLSKVKDEDNPYYLPTTQDGHHIHSGEMDMGALMTVCTLAITLLLVYGTVKGKASHLLPFFCLQLFDFAITTLTATGYFCYLRSVHNFVNEHWHNLPYRKELLQLSPQYLSLIVIAAFFFSMLWKVMMNKYRAYCINIVWRCYKYLTLRQQATRSTVHYILPTGETAERIPEPDYSSLLPDYDAACASAMKQPPPPSYQAAMEAQLPPYPDTVHIVNLTVNRDEFSHHGFVVAHNINGNGPAAVVQEPPAAEQAVEMSAANVGNIAAAAAVESVSNTAVDPLPAPTNKE